MTACRLSVIDRYSSCFAFDGWLYAIIKEVYKRGFINFAYFNTLLDIGDTLVGLKLLPVYETLAPFTKSSGLFWSGNTLLNIEYIAN